MWAFKLLFFFFLSISQSISTTPSTTISPEAACNTTLDPAFCETILPPKPNQNLYSYCLLSILKSKDNALRLLDVVDNTLSQNSTLGPEVVHALEDCDHLMRLNVDFLHSTNETLHQRDNAVGDDEADRLDSYLSALITNHQTCLDGLEAIDSSNLAVNNTLLTSLYDGTKLYSVSLALFKKAWPLPDPKSRSSFVGTVTRRGLLKSLTRAAVVVRKDGKGHFTKIMDAIKSAPEENNANKGYFVIHVASGIYQEYVVVPKTKKYIKIIGAGIGKTIITGSHSAKDGWNTWESATLAVDGEGFVAIGITVRNTADQRKGQAVAMRSSADLSAFYKCSFEGHQDTLFAHSLRQFYKSCDIYGTVDFIFGNAAMVLQDCNIYPRLPMTVNVVAAHARTDPNQNTGISMQNCNFKAAPELAAAKRVVETYLGRPWKKYSRIVIMQSYMDRLIHPTGWLAKDGTEFGLDTGYYGEYANTGPGSDTRGRVKWPAYKVLHDNSATKFTVSNFIFGDVWLPRTGVPYFGGVR